MVLPVVRLRAVHSCRLSCRRIALPLPLLLLLLPPPTFVTVCCYCLPCLFLRAQLCSGVCWRAWTWSARWRTPQWTAARGGWAGHAGLQGWSTVLG